MTRKLRAALHFSGLAALALATASCGGAPPNPQGQTDSGNFSLFNPMGQWPSTVPAFSEADYFGDALPPLPDAAPMVRAVSREGGYRYAPSYDYPADEPIYYDSEPSDNSYAWLALASLLGGVFEDAPPDYYFDYDGVEPWVWETGDDFVRYAEPLDYGYRYYYYAPGRSYPFLVRDPYYSYGYYDDRVVVIYDRDGRVLDGRRSWRQRQVADRYYARAHALNEAARLRPRYGVEAPLWAERRPIIAGEQRQWDRARAQRAAWRNWDRRHEQVTAPRWTRERVARQYAARRFDNWQNQDYRGPAPRFYEEAERSPRLRQAMAEQRARAVPPRVQRREALAQRREQMRAFAQNDNLRRGAGWQASPSAERAGWAARNANRDEARVERQRGRQARFDERRAERSGLTGQRVQNEVRPAQAERREFARQREQQRIVATDRGRAEVVRAQREARAQQRAQFRAAQGQEQRQARIQQREQSRVQQRNEWRQQRAQAMQSQRREQVRAQRAQAQSQQRNEWRQQRAQAMQSRQSEQVRAQRAQAQAQQRQEFRSQQRAQFRQQRNEAAMQQRMQARQEARAQQHQQRAQMQAQQQSQAREQFRAQRQEQRVQAQQQSGGGQANGHAQRMAERQSHGGGRGGRRSD